MDLATFYFIAGSIAGTLAVVAFVWALFRAGGRPAPTPRSEVIHTPGRDVVNDYDRQVAQMRHAAGFNPLDPIRSPRPLPVPKVRGGDGVRVSAILTGMLAAFICAGAVALLGYGLDPTTTDGLRNLAAVWLFSCAITCTR